MQFFSREKKISIGNCVRLETKIFFSKGFISWTQIGPQKNKLEIEVQQKLNKKLKNVPLLSSRLPSLFPPTSHRFLLSCFGPHHRCIP